MRRVIYIQLFLYGVGETQLNELYYLYVMLVGRILGRLERLDIFFFYLLFLFFMVFSYFSTSLPDKFLPPLSPPTLPPCFYFIFLVDEKIAYFCSTTVSKNLLNTFPDGTINPPLNMKQPTNTPDHPRTHEIHFPTSLFFFFFSSLV